MAELPELEASPAVANYLRDHKQALIEELLDRGEHDPDESPEDRSDRTQFYYGWVSVLEAAAHGNADAAGEYVRMIVPGLRGMVPLDSMVDGLVGIGAVLGRRVPEEGFEWIMAYLSNYTRTLFAAWEEGA